MNVHRRSLIGLTCAAVVALGVASISPITAGAQTKKFTVGWSIPTGQNPWINAIQSSAERVIKKAGGTLESA